MSLTEYVNVVMGDHEQETIVAAAIEHEGTIYHVPPPGRHHHICHKMVLELGLPVNAQRNQGFLTNTGRFVGRREAADIARAAGQIIKKTGPENELFSEDVW